MTELSQTGAAAGVVGCVIELEVSPPAKVEVQVAAARRRGVALDERLEVVSNGMPVTAQELAGADGGRRHLIHAQPGALTVTYRATVTRTATATPEPATDAESVIALRPSRYCPSDRMAGFARSHFGDLPTALERVQAITAYVWRHIGYETATSGSSTDAVETLLTGRGVCRDFAHLVAALCRAVDIPARVASVYPPGLSPMDFHAVAETAIDGVWWMWDATRLAPRPTLVRISTGRDAADIAFATVISGRVEFGSMEITAVATGDLPLDDHEKLVALA